MSDDLLRNAERAVADAAAEADKLERQRADFEKMGLIRNARIAAKYQREARNRLARAMADLESLKGSS